MHLQAYTAYSYIAMHVNNVTIYKKLCKLLCIILTELGKLLYESNILHITSYYFYKEVIYYSYILATPSKK